MGVASARRNMRIAINRVANQLAVTYGRRKLEMWMLARYLRDGRGPTC